MGVWPLGRYVSVLGSGCVYFLTRNRHDAIKRGRSHTKGAQQMVVHTNQAANLTINALAAVGSGKEAVCNLRNGPKYLLGDCGVGGAKGGNTCDLISRRTCDASVGDEHSHRSHSLDGLESFPAF